MPNLLLYGLKLLNLLTGKVTTLSQTGWTEWQEITIREDWMEITPLDGYLFSVQTDIVDTTTGIRFYVNTDPETLININIPAKSGKTIDCVFRN